MECVLLICELMKLGAYCIVDFTPNFYESCLFIEPRFLFEVSRA